jgi:hypothetical protein
VPTNACIAKCRGSVERDPEIRVGSAAPNWQVEVNAVLRQTVVAHGKCSVELPNFNRFRVVCEPWRHFGSGLLWNDANAGLAGFTIGAFTAALTAQWVRSAPLIAAILRTCRTTEVAARLRIAGRWVETREVHTFVVWSTNVAFRAFDVPVAPCRVLGAKTGAIAAAAVSNVFVATADAFTFRCARTKATWGTQNAAQVGACSPSTHRLVDAYLGRIRIAKVFLHRLAGLSAGTRFGIA